MQQTKPRLLALPELIHFSMFWKYFLSFRKENLWQKPWGFSYPLSYSKVFLFIFYSFFG